MKLAMFGHNVALRNLIDFFSMNCILDTVVFVKVRRVVISLCPASMTMYYVSIVDCGRSPVTPSPRQHEH